MEERAQIAPAPRGEGCLWHRRQLAIPKVLILGLVLPPGAGRRGRAGGFLPCTRDVQCVSEVLTLGRGGKSWGGSGEEE